MQHGSWIRLASCSHFLSPPAFHFQNLPFLPQGWGKAEKRHSSFNQQKGAWLCYGVTHEILTQKNSSKIHYLCLTWRMPPHRINIYADRQWVNERLPKKRERSKTTELRPSNEDLGKNTANVLIVWQALHAPAPCSPPSIPFTCFSNANRPSGVGFKTGTTLQGYGAY